MLLYIRLNINLFIGLCFLLFWSKPIQSQTINKFNCYAIDDDNNLYEYNSSFDSWINKGTIFALDIQTSRDIEAIALNPIQNIIYAVDRNIFGTIDINTLAFTPIDYISGSKLAYGEYGNQLFNDITAMSYDPYSNCLWAINRNAGFGPGTEDYLIKIDPKTGIFIPGSFENGFDYAVVPSVYDVTLDGEVFDVEAIAIDPYTKKLYAIQSQHAPGVLTEINKLDGGIESVVYDFQEDDIKGLSFSSSGMLLGATGNGGLTAHGSIFSVDLTNASAINLGTIDTTNTSQNFESLVCDAGVFDLALKINLSSNPIVQVDDELTFDIEILNQGNLEVNKYTLSVYLPEFSFFSSTDSNWVFNNNRRFETTAKHTIYPGATHTQSLTLRLNGTTEDTAIIAAEITDFQSNRINEQNNRVMSLPDIDSTPDDIDNEINVIDNSISGGGLQANQDEDDHDIVEIQIEHPCETSWYLTNSFLEGVYSAYENIISSSSLFPYTHIRFISESTITLQSGFTVYSNTYFEAEISKCQ